MKPIANTSRGRFSEGEILRYYEQGACTYIVLKPLASLCPRGCDNCANEGHMSLLRCVSLGREGFYCVGDLKFWIKVVEG